jgi:hypothetical protein
MEAQVKTKEQKQAEEAAMKQQREEMMVVYLNAYQILKDWDISKSFIMFMCGILSCDKDQYNVSLKKLMCIQVIYYTYNQYFLQLVSLIFYNFFLDRKYQQNLQLQNIYAYIYIECNCRKRK